MSSHGPCAYSLAPEQLQSVSFEWRMFRIESLISEIHYAVTELVTSEAKTVCKVKPTGTECTTNELMRQSLPTPSSKRRKRAKRVRLRLWAAANVQCPLTDMDAGQDNVSVNFGANRSCPPVAADDDSPSQADHEEHFHLPVPSPLLFLETVDLARAECVSKAHHLFVKGLYDKLSDGATNADEHIAPAGLLDNVSRRIGSDALDQAQSPDEHWEHIVDQVRCCLDDFEGSVRAVYRAYLLAEHNDSDATQSTTLSLERRGVAVEDLVMQLYSSLYASCPDSGTKRLLEERIGSTKEIFRTRVTAMFAG